MTSRSIPTGGRRPFPPCPPSVRLAVRLMFATAVVGLVDVLVSALGEGSLRRKLIASNSVLSRHEIDSLLAVSIGFGVGLGVVVLVLYVALTFPLRRARPWARVVVWVVAGLGVLATISTLTQTATVPMHVVSAVQGVLDVAVIVALARPDAVEFFRAYR